MVWATFWATFSQTHLVTLTATCGFKSIADYLIIQFTFRSLA
jgi:hypothetical protein